MGFLLDLQATDKAVQDQLASFSKLISKLNQQVADFKAEAEGEALTALRLPKDATTAERRTAEKMAANAVRGRVAEFRRTLVDSSEKERTARLQPLHDANAKAIKFKPLFESSMTVLSGEGLGSERRTHLEAQLRDVGPAQLATQAHRARVTQDKVLAAAILNRIDNLPSKARPFSRQQFSDEFAGAEAKAGQAAVRSIDEAFQRGVVINREFQRGQVDSTARISLGLASRARGAA